MIGRGILEVREIFEMSQEDLAVASGLTEQFIDAVERGVVEPDFEHVNAIAEALRIPVTYVEIFSNQTDDALLAKFKATAKKLMLSCRVKD